MLKIGQIVKEKFSEIEYVVVGRKRWMFGCDIYICEPITNDLKDKTSIFGITNNDAEFSESRLLVVRDTEYVEDFVEGNKELLFGKKVKDKVTGFKGICIGVYQTLGCADRYIVQKRCKKRNDKATVICSFDEGRLEILSDGINPKEVTENQHKPGGVEDGIFNNQLKMLKKLNKPAIAEY